MSQEEVAEIHQNMTEIQLIIKALTDLYESIPEDERYQSLIRITVDKMESEFEALMKLIVKKF